MKAGLLDMSRAKPAGHGQMEFISSSRAQGGLSINLVSLSFLHGYSKPLSCTLEKEGDQIHSALRAVCSYSCLVSF